MIVAALGLFVHWVGVLVESAKQSRWAIRDTHQLYRCTYCKGVCPFRRRPVTNIEQAGIVLEGCWMGVDGGSVGRLRISMGGGRETMEGVGRALPCIVYLAIMSGGSDAKRG